MGCKHGMSSPELCSICSENEKQTIMGLTKYQKKLLEREEEDTVKEKEEIAELEEELEEEEKREKIERELEYQEKAKKHQEWVKKELKRGKAASERSERVWRRELERQYKRQVRQEAKELQELLAELVRDEKHREEEEWKDILNELLEEHDKREERKKKMKNRRIAPASKTPLTQGQLVTHLALKHELMKRTVSFLIEDMATLAMVEVRKTGVFVFPGVGKIVLCKRKARNGFNPATGKQIHIRAKTVMKMRFAEGFKEVVLSPKKK